jgi:hypothetical protein
MQCNCGEVLAQEVPGVVCVKCKAKFHRECFESQVEGSHFYCELCTLKLMEPLVAFDQKDELAFREVEYSAAPLVLPVRLSDDQIADLEAKSLFLSICTLTPGVIDAEPEELSGFIGGTAFSIMTDRFNILNFSTVAKQFKQNRKNKNHAVNFSLTLSPFKGKKWFFVHLTRKLKEAEPFNYAISIKSSTHRPDGRFRCLSSMLAMSKGKTVPLAIPVTCPLTTMIMAYPGKGGLCKHPDFFCIKNYIRLNLTISQTKNRWRCPICMKRVFYRDLYLDDLLQSVISEHKSEFRETLSDSDGSVKLSTEGGPDASRHGDKCNKLYILNGEILTKEELNKKTKPLSITVKKEQSSHVGAGEGWTSILGNTTFLPLPNPNSLTNISNENKWIEISKSRASKKSSMNSKISPIGSERVINFERPLESSEIKPDEGEVMTRQKSFSGKIEPEPEPTVVSI